MPGIAAVVALAVLGVGGGDWSDRPELAGGEWSWTADRLGPMAAGESEEMDDLSGEPGSGGPQSGGSGAAGSGTSGSGPGGSGPGGSGSEREVRLRVRQEAMPATLIAGERATLRVTVTNPGPAEAADVTVTDTLDPALTPDPAALPDGCERAGRAVTCGGPGTTLLPGQNLTYDLPITVDPSLRDGVEVVARAEATGSPESGPAEVALLAAPVRAFADVELVLAAPPAVHAGDVIGYLLTVTNRGPARAADVTVWSRNRDPGATVTDRPAAECPGSGRTVACDLGDLAPGEVRTLALAIAPGASVPFESCATVRTAGRDRDRADNRSCASTRVEPAPAPAELPPPPARPERPDLREPLAEASYDEPPRQMDEPFAPAAAKGDDVVTEEEAPRPAGEEVAAGVPMAGMSLWMLALGVPVLLAIGLMVRFLDRQGRAGRAR
ncbi:hypothetical protein AB0G05_08035 [Nonomuraea wenchangensis]